MAYLENGKLFLHKNKYVPNAICHATRQQPLWRILKCKRDKIKRTETKYAYTLKHSVCASMGSDWAFTRKRSLDSTSGHRAQRD